MKIIILGAGHTGAAVAQALAKEGNDIVVIDVDADRLRELQDRTDIATVVGAGTYPDTLKRASAEGVDLLVAVMPRDEDNLVACQVAWALFQPHLIIARIREISYLEYPELFSKQNFPIDVLIRPEALVMHHVQKLIEYPGVHQLYNFANGIVKFVAVDVQDETEALGMNLDQLSEHLPGIRWVGLYRDGTAIPLDAQPRIETGDRLLYVAPDELVRDTIKFFRSNRKPYKRIILSGGGHVGKRVAEALQQKFSVKLIEINPDRASHIAEELDKTMVLCGDASDRELLIDEGIEETDMYCALTASDETNILSSMLAKKLGVGKTLCLVNKPAFVDMILPDAIDMVFSPEKITTASILRYVRKGVINVCPIQSTELEAMEFVIEGNSDTSKVVGLALSELALPDGVIIGAIVRGEIALDLQPDMIIENRDHLILIAPVTKFSNIAKYFNPSV